MYIDYNYYSQNGGVVDNTAFNILVRTAQRKLDAYTFNRLQGLAEQTEQVKQLMVDLINLLSTMDSKEIKSFNNDGVSITYADRDTENDLKSLIVEVLPIELVSAVANYEIL